MKILACGTNKKNTTDIVRRFAQGIDRSGEAKTEFIDVRECLDSGIPDGTDAIMSLGILRGTGLVFQEAAQKCITRYYIDHAYFNPGYNHPCWLRVVKNHHTMNWFKQSDPSRWRKFFEAQNKIHSWKRSDERGEYIYVCPPTHAISWYFGAEQWLELVIKNLHDVLPETEHWRIKIRHKPSEPIVDPAGNLIRVQKNEVSESLEQLFQNANCVISYNSMVSLTALLHGIPVITSVHNCCNTVSFSINDFKDGPKPEKFDIEPNREQLCYWLSNCQYNLNELETGAAFKHILGTQNE